MKTLQDENRESASRLEELEDLKDKFVLIASHDLKGGLSAIRDGLHLLETVPVLDQGGAERSARILAGMRGSVDEMESLLEGFLDLQAIKAGVLELQMRRLSLNDLVEEAIERFQSYADVKSVSLQSHLGGSLPETMGDPARLSHIVDNLLSSAIKHSLEGREVVLRTRRIGDWLRVEVQDSGAGVQEEGPPSLSQDLAFGQNSQLAGDRSRGVGLSIIRQLIELHGGRVGAESTPGAGSLFWFELPKA